MGRNAIEAARAHQARIGRAVLVSDTSVLFGFSYLFGYIAFIVYINLESWASGDPPYPTGIVFGIPFAIAALPLSAIGFSIVFYLLVRGLGLFLWFRLAVGVSAAAGGYSGMGLAQFVNIDFFPPAVNLEPNLIFDFPSMRWIAASSAGLVFFAFGVDRSP